MTSTAHLVAPLVGGVCASVDGMLCGAMGLDDLPCGWRSNVRRNTTCGRGGESGDVMITHHQIMLTATCQ